MNNFKHFLKNIMITFLEILAHHKCSSIPQYWDIPESGTSSFYLLSNGLNFVLLSDSGIVQYWTASEHLFFTHVAQFWNIFKDQSMAVQSHGYIVTILEYKSIIMFYMYHCSTLKCYQSEDMQPNFVGYFKAFRGVYCYFLAEILYSFQWDFLCLGYFLMLTTATFGNYFWQPSSLTFQYLGPIKYTSPSSVINFSKVFLPIQNR